MNVNEAYVGEILDQLPDGLTRIGFFLRCQPDVNAGWRREVDEAWRLYRDQGRATVRRVRQVRL